MKFQTLSLNSSLCDYSDAYILVKGIIPVANTAAADADSSNTNVKYYSSFHKLCTIKNEIKKYTNR